MSESSEGESRFLDLGRFELRRGGGGFLAARYEETNYDLVHLHQAFPLSLPDEYISVRDGEGAEIGIIHRLDGLSREQRTLAEEELSRRYFAPEVTEVSSLKEEFGYLYWDVETEAGERRFTQQSKPETVLSAGRNEIVVLDIDGNRYRVPEYRKTLKRYLKVLDAIL